MTPRRRNAGFTFIEVVVTGAMAGLLFLLFSQSFASSSQLGTTAHMGLMAHDNARRSLDAVANVVRGAYWDTLGELDDTQPTTVLGFQRVVDISTSGAAVLGSDERIEWRAVAGAVDGIAHPGSLVHVTALGGTVIAPRVPQGGFKAVLAGNLLSLQLTTWHGVHAGRVANITLSCAVALRN